VLIGIVADTHMPRAGPLPAACARELARAELILHAGDIATVAALEELSAIGPPLHAVHGNVDEEPLRRRLPAALELEIAGARVAMVHDAGPAHGRLRRLRARFPTAEAVIFGHSHMPLCERSADGFQIFNPGSPTQRRRAPRRSLGLAHAREGEIRFEHVYV
jgi:putative phosphoesterase